MMPQLTPETGAGTIRTMRVRLHLSIARIGCVLKESVLIGRPRTTPELTAVRIRLVYRRCLRVYASVRDSPLVQAAVPKSTLGLLGRLFGALSLFALLDQAASLGLSVTFEAILSIYNTAVRLTIGFFDPVIKDFLTWLSSHLPFSIPFSEAWRHIFLVLQILFIRDAGTAFSDGRRTLAAVRLITGTIIALIVSVLAFMADSASPLSANVVLSIIPIFGLFIYDITMYGFSATMFFDAVGAGEMRSKQSRIQFFRTGLWRSLFRFLLVGGLSASLLFVPFIATLPFPHGGVLAMIVGLFVNACYWIVMGSSYAFTQQRASGVKWKRCFLQSEAGRFGLAVAGILFWFMVFSALNAGAQIIGL